MDTVQEKNNERGSVAVSPFFLLKSAGMGAPFGRIQKEVFNKMAQTEEGKKTNKTSNPSRSRPKPALRRLVF